MKSILLAAGYGTRLYPLTRDLPKPLLEINKKPMVERILGKVHHPLGPDQYWVVTNDRFAAQFEKWAKVYRGNASVEIVNDGTTTPENRLGAIRDIQHVLKLKNIQEDLLVVAGDNLLELDMEAFYRRFRELKSPLVGVKQLGNRELAKKYGVLELDANSKVLNFVEKPANPPTDLISVCLYAFPKESLALIDRYVLEGNNPDAPGNYIAWLSQQIDVYGFKFSETWFDIGDLASYNEANLLYKKLEG